jgi:signal transduction histidine kinase
VKIKTKLTFLIGGGMILLLLVFLFAGTIFSIHEVLLIKKHELKVAARRINTLVEKTKNINNKVLTEKIEQGLLFMEKKENLHAVIFDSNGNKIYTCNDALNESLDKSRYPEAFGDFNNQYKWLNWNHWKINFFFRGNNCYIHMNLIQKLEIQEDISMFFLGSLVLSVFLSLIVGRFITARILKRAEKLEEAAHMIAAGNLKFRIPDSNSNDEVQVIENNLNDAFSELEESFDKIMEFSSDIAHELRTPLTIITGEIDVALGETRSTEEYQILMVNIMEEVNLLRKIVDDMLILVKPESAYRSIPKESIDLSTMIKDIIVNYSIIADSKNIKINSTIEEGVNSKGIKSMKYLVFSNLINNAIKYTQEGGEINITLTSDINSITFSVKDSGPGIEKEEQEKIFSRFYRLKSNSTRGSGLGLAIVKKVCDISNATIKLQSIPGKGSTFTVTIPKAENL